MLGLSPSTLLPQRQVEGLRFALLQKKGPFRRTKLKGVQALGRRYQRRVSKYLRHLWPQAEHREEQWIRFLDAGGLGWAQPDHIVVIGREALLVEAKLSWTPRAVLQLTGLYLPLLQGFGFEKIHMLCIFCRICPGTEPPWASLVEDPRDTLDKPVDGVWNCHWLVL